MFLALAQLTNKAFTDAGKGRIRQSLTALVSLVVDRGQYNKIWHLFMGGASVSLGTSNRDNRVNHQIFMVGLLKKNMQNYIIEAITGDLLWLFRSPVELCYKPGQYNIPSNL